MTLGGLFSGVGGFELAATWAGIEPVWSNEIDPFCCEVLRKNFKHEIIEGDIRNIGLKNLWEDYVQNVKSQIAHQEDHIVNHATPKEQKHGGIRIESDTEKERENGFLKEKKRSLTITEQSVFVAENLKWNFSLLTINSIMEIKSEEDINLKLGKLLLKEDSLTNIKSFATTATMLRLISEFVLTIKKYNTDVITAGFPCQPASTAGKRRGTKDDRWLWPETIRIIREFCPSYVVLENVRGLLTLEGGMVFESVCAEMEAIGYQVLPFIIPACAVNAPHRRDRVWIVAYSGCIRPEKSKIETMGLIELSERRTITNTDNTGLQRRKVNGSTGKVREKQGQFVTGFIQPKWNNFPTVSPVRGRNDGVPSWLVKSSLKAYGNAIVPQIATEIFKAILDYDRHH